MPITISTNNLDYRLRYCNVAQKAFQLQSRAVWHLLLGAIVLITGCQEAPWILSSFEFSLCLFLPIYSRTAVIDRYCVFTASEEDVYELGVMSVLWCAIYTKSFREFIKNLQGVSKKLLFKAAQGFNSQYFNLFGFSISVRFVWCII